MKYFIIAGEASGDLHASNLVEELFQLDPSAVIQGMGGVKMQKAGVQLCVDYKEYSFMGFVEVLQNLGKIRRLLKTIKSQIDQFHPDKVILVDYGGFNLKIAKYFKEKGIQTHFYILPKAWAWNEKRVVKLKKYVDFGYCIFPFEEAYFLGHGVNAHYIGNPVVEQILRFKEKNLNIKRQNTVALLPGSRKQEIERILPTMLAFAATKPEIQFVVAAHDQSLYTLFQFPSNVTFSEVDTYTTVSQSKAAIVTSGTANLETALLDTPQVVCYKANAFSYAIGKRLVKLQYISPVNLILDKHVIKELLQDDLNVLHLDTEVTSLLQEATATKIRDGYQELWTVLGESSAAKQTAKKIIEA